MLDTRLSPSFWLNTGVTLLILLGPAVADSGGGGVRAAFVQRFLLFVGVTLYAWFALWAVERARAWSAGRVTS